MDTSGYFVTRKLVRERLCSWLKHETDTIHLFHLFAERLEVIQGTLAASQDELAAHKAKLIKYETELVDLSNAADKVCFPL